MAICAHIALQYPLLTKLQTCRHIGFGVDADLEL